MDAGVASGFSHLASRENTRTLSFLFSSPPRAKSPPPQAVAAAQGRQRRCRSSPMHPASPSSRRLASDPAALATPPTPFFSSLLVRISRGGNRRARAHAAAVVGRDGFDEAFVA